TKPTRCSGTTTRRSRRRSRPRGWGRREASYPPPCGEGRERSERGGGRCDVARAGRQTSTPTPALRADPPHQGEDKPAAPPSHSGNAQRLTPAHNTASVAARLFASEEHP